MKADTRTGNELAEALRGTPTGSVISMLRAATGERHAMIEQLLRLDASLEMPRYRLVITGFEAFITSWEALVATALPARLHEWFMHRSRLVDVRRDVAALHLRPVPEASRVQHRIELPSTAAVFGSLYVIEGSALGGQVISRRINEHFGIGPGNGGAYFNGRGKQTGAMWREFQQMLESEVGDDPAMRTQACTAAVQTFDALAHTFRKFLDEPLAA